MNRYLSLAAAENQRKASMSDYWQKLSHMTAGKVCMTKTRRLTTHSRRMAVRTAVLTMVLSGAMGFNTAAAENCIRFHNKDPNIPVLHVSFDTDPTACPTGTCWQADIPAGEVREYCPGPLVYPAPFLGRPFRLVFSRSGNFWADRFGLLGNHPGKQTTFLCEIVVQGGLNTRGCEGANLGDRPW